MCKPELSNPRNVKLDPRPDSYNPEKSYSRPTLEPKVAQNNFNMHKVLNDNGLFELI